MLTPHRTPGAVEYPSWKSVVRVDRAKAARLGVPQGTVSQALATMLGGEDMSHVHGDNLKYAVPIRVKYAEQDKSDLDQVLSLRVRSQTGTLAPLSEIVQVVDSRRAHSIQHKGLLPVVYVTGDMAGETDSPLYGMFDIAANLDQQDLQQWLLTPPATVPGEIGL